MEEDLTTGSDAAHVVLGKDGNIYGVYSTDDGAKHCKKYVERTLNVTCEIRYFIIDKNFKDFK